MSGLTVRSDAPEDKFIAEQRLRAWPVNQLRRELRPDDKRGETRKAGRGREHLGMSGRKKVLSCHL